MKPAPTSPRPWRKQNGGTFSPSNKSSPTIKLIMPSDLITDAKPWMERMKRIERALQVPPNSSITPISITSELKRRNSTLRSNEDISHVPQLGTAPVAHIKGDIEALKQDQRSAWYLDIPEWSAMTVLTARASNVFIDKLHHLCDRVDRCTNRNKMGSLFAEIDWTRKEMHRRLMEYHAEVGATERVLGVAEDCDEKDCL